MSHAAAAWATVYAVPPLLTAVCNLLNVYPLTNATVPSLVPVLLVDSFDAIALALVKNSFR